MRNFAILSAIYALGCAAGVAGGGGDTIAITVQRMDYNRQLTLPYWNGRKIQKMEPFTIDIPISFDAIGFQLYRLDIKSSIKLMEINGSTQEQLEKYMTVAIVQLVSRKGKGELVWKAVCNRTPKTATEIRKAYPMGTHFMVVTDEDKNRIQFQCPNFGATRVNVSLKPINQTDVWKPLGLKRWNLFRYRGVGQFSGFRLHFPKPTLLDISYLTAQALRMFQNKGLECKQTQSTINKVLDKLKKTKLKVSTCEEYKSVMKVVRIILNDENVRNLPDSIAKKLVQVHSNLYRFCAKQAYEFQPTLADYQFLLVRRIPKFTDVLLLQMVSSELGELSLKPLELVAGEGSIEAKGLVPIAASRFLETDKTNEFTLHWECVDFGKKGNSEEKGNSEIVNVVTKTSVDTTTCSSPLVGGIQLTDKGTHRFISLQDQTMPSFSKSVTAAAVFPTNFEVNALEKLGFTNLYFDSGNKREDAEEKRRAYLKGAYDSLMTHPVIESKRLCPYYCHSLGILTSETGRPSYISSMFKTPKCNHLFDKCCLSEDRNLWEFNHRAVFEG